MLKNKLQLSIADEAERKIRQSQKECQHVFGPAILAIDHKNNETMYFAECKICGFKVD